MNTKTEAHYYTDANIRYSDERQSPDDYRMVYRWKHIASRRHGRREIFFPRDGLNPTTALSRLIEHWNRRGDGRWEYSVGWL